MWRPCLKGHREADVAVQHLQEVVRQLPESAQYRSMLSKQWTDCTYLDVGPAHEKLTDDDRRQFNQTALEHARQVLCPHWVTTRGVHPGFIRMSCAVCDMSGIQHTLDIKLLPQQQSLDTERLGCKCCILSSGVAATGLSGSKLHCPCTGWQVVSAVCLCSFKSCCSCYCIASLLVLSLSCGQEYLPCQWQ